MKIEHIALYVNDLEAAPEPPATVVTKAAFWMPSRIR